ncbi:MAG: sulfite exporter TauE/SafE family protein [Gemmatimonadetes bacterium]|nr:sulfite exporter TauE/SafE family protein [Gemmatimonadota bacterium]MCC7133627.1 sulfite exporter TauE/SafE family protein [Gemmatimonadales bacterium]
MVDPSLANGGLTVGTLIGAGFAAVVGGAINSIAGGGTLVTFPAIVALGVPPLTANATNTMALWPGAFGSLWGYREQLAGMRSWVARFSVPSVLGGLSGGWLLLSTGQERFARIVPFLVLGATVLFMLNGPLGRWLRGRGAAGAEAEPQGGPFFFLAQFLVGVYGGYFGAGIGILMLAVLGLVGFTDIHRMNAVKVWGALLMNVVAAGLFAWKGVVLWPLALVMAVGAIVGGYGGSRFAMRVGQVWVRRAVVAIGMGSFLWLLVRR